MQKRSGLSLVEFVGCVAALGGGVVLGSVYFGVDLQQTAYQVLQQTELIDPNVLGWEVPKTASQEEPQSELPADECPKPDEATELSEFLAEENSEPIEQSAIERTPQVEPQPVEMTEPQRQAATKAYWNAFVACIRTEAAQRSPSINYENWQFLDYLIHRQKGHEQVVETLQALDRRGVDARLLAHTDAVLLWHKSGNKLFSRAVNLLTNGPHARFTGPFAQSWQSAATQHRMEGKLVRDKHHVIVGYLNHAYESQAPFPPVFEE
ncbi:MAG: hypothetical protein MI725_17720 [Pirellulales bacterium]|nr:hypothetical protein [Pirellulales bacterium]